MMVADKFPNGLIGLIGLRIIGTIGTIRTIKTIKVVTDKFPNGLNGPIGLNPIFPINSTSISKINLLLEGCRVLHSAKMPPMGSTRYTSHWWHFF